MGQFTASSPLLVALAVLAQVTSHVVAYDALLSATFRDASCSALQEITKDVVALDTCVPSSDGKSFFQFLCAADGKTFVQNTFPTPNCTGVHSQYQGTSGLCVQNMRYTFSRFTCIVQEKASTLATDDFEAWLTHSDKRDAYLLLSGAAAAARLATFRANTQYIAAHNARLDTTYSMRMNQFGDMTRDEFHSLHRNRAGRRAERTTHPALSSAPASTAPPPPPSWDWRARGAVSSVKNQFEPHSCGSCWAFSAVAGMESRYAMDGNKVLSLSAQNLIDCTLRGADTCAQGGEMHDGVLQVAIEQNGAIASDSSYKYTGFSKKVCHFNDSTTTRIATNTSGYRNVSVGDEVELASALVSGGVIPAGINSDADAFMFYSEGILDIPAAKCKSGPQDLDHGVAVVGYGSAAARPGKEEVGEQYWIVKNSYGLYWGEKGFFRIVRGRNSCGIATDAIVVLGAAGRGGGGNSLDVAELII